MNEQFHEPSYEVDPILRHIADNPRGEPLTWGATPLCKDKDIQLQQLEVKAELETYFEGNLVPEWVDPELAEYVQSLNMARTLRREDRNYGSYEFRQKTDLEGVPLEALCLVERARRGSASPAELLYMAKTFGIPTIELGSLTHPYGQRFEYLEEMRAAIKDAIVLHGGVLEENARPDIKVKSVDNFHDPERMRALHMTRDTYIGLLEDETIIKERSSFVVLVNKLKPAHIEAIKTVPLKDNPNRLTQIRRAGELYKTIPPLLEKDRHDIAIPISTTTIAMNEKLMAELLNEDAMVARIRQKLAAVATSPSGMYFVKGTNVATK